MKVTTNQISFCGTGSRARVNHNLEIDVFDSICARLHSESLFFSRFTFEGMNHKKFWTVVALVTSFAGIPSLGRTEATKQSSTAKPEVQATEVVKVGEYQAEDNNTVVTQIHSHEMDGKAAATLYVRNIPVITFIGSSASADTEAETKVGAVQESDNGQAANIQSGVRVASSQNLTQIKNTVSVNNSDPVQRASVVAARINDLVRANVDASKIAVSWKPSEPATAANKALENSAASVERYEIKADGQKVVEINPNTRLAGATENLAADALQATNRLRRLIGGAEPITEISNLPPTQQIAGISLPRPAQQIASVPVRSTILGIASFYWQGQRTATGERFNPNGLTAAHRSLPFGTRVRVTNKRNGRSVVVRINDRGPFIRGRVIDLSLGAARAIGMVGNGLAPVKVEVLGR